jgi:hypothetical protein
VACLTSVQIECIYKKNSPRTPKKPSPRTPTPKKKTSPVACFTSVHIEYTRFSWMVHGRSPAHACICILAYAYVCVCVCRPLACVSLPRIPIAYTCIRIRIRLATNAGTDLTDFFWGGGEWRRSRSGGQYWSQWSGSGCWGERGKRAAEQQE